MIALFGLLGTLLISSIQAQELERKAVRGCQQFGFFAEFFWVLNHLQWCITTNQTPVIYWDSRFAYYSPQGYNGSTNAWEYYFEPVSKLSYQPGDPVHTPCFYNQNFSVIWWYSEYINNLGLLPPDERDAVKSVPLPKGLAGNAEYPVYKHLYDVSFRKYVKEELIDPFIRIKPSIRKKIDDFHSTHMKGKHIIGIHLRGNFVWGEVSVVPVETLCEEANKLASRHTIFYVATDQKPLLDQAIRLLKGTVIYYPCYRQETTTSPWLSGQWPPEMGEDVLIEAKLLSYCNHLVHTISNLSTAALYFNPRLSHTALYCGGSDK
ncbi:MAG: hypothetical protein JSR58_08135 [Verrucomicrobia bacterium]|nr:hypothetical protein [Verrucomicrobiota bacterium]